MSEVRPFTIESFYKFVGEGKLMAAKCINCGAVTLPPRPACSKCLSQNLKWIPVDEECKLLTYTMIHVSPKEFESKVPYALGIVKFDDGSQLLGMIRDIEPNKIQIGMTLKVDFEKTSTSPSAPAQTQPQWPQWPRYFFKPA
ncbi:MAG TPA: Zn-ribbon domain-containing OB-fold protein [Candidatus Bathyarchaeia archaeon]|nr:Zn-ribbon domain-containing OB-fold protein [Candidatus Bathyarchaeia archaeon]